MNLKKYDADKTILKFLITEKTTQVDNMLENDSRVPIFEKIWKSSCHKRGAGRKKANQKVKNIVVNLIRSVLSYDRAIRETEEAIWNTRTQVSTPLLFASYKICGEPPTVPDDYRITFYSDLENESLQGGKRGRAAKEKMKNIVYHLFYYVNCRKETLGWHTEILKS